MNCSMVVVCQSRGYNGSVFRCPKKPSQAAFTGEHPLLDTERVSFSSCIRESQPGRSSLLAPLSIAESNVVFTRSASGRVPIDKLTTDQAHGDRRGDQVRARASDYLRG